LSFAKVSYGCNNLTNPVLTNIVLT